MSMDSGGFVVTVEVSLSACDCVSLSMTRGQILVSVFFCSSMEYMNNSFLFEKIDFSARVKSVQNVSFAISDQVRSEICPENGVLIFQTHIHFLNG